MGWRKSAAAGKIGNKKEGKASKQASTKDAMEARFEAIAEENNASCAFYAQPTNHQVAWWDDDNQGATISLVDLTYTSNGQGMDSSKDD
ncbi:Hydroxymethylglutaryl-CoA lyase, mitochondrial [Hordeum vulgare]|nr:Hydroxymethylglutaryl-CoA lyase, mitochondrial [Hordeum vulgare]